MPYKQWTRFTHSLLRSSQLYFRGLSHTINMFSLTSQLIFGLSSQIIGNTYYVFNICARLRKVIVGLSNKSLVSFQIYSVFLPAPCKRYSRSCFIMARKFGVGCLLYWKACTNKFLKESLLNGIQNPSQRHPSHSRGGRKLGIPNIHPPPPKFKRSDIMKLLFMTNTSRYLPRKTSRIDHSVHSPPYFCF